MEEYIKVLLEQIRCKKAHEPIVEELTCHMEEQIADNLEAGMTPEEAERAAVADMGSPVEAGISLDRIHRPSMAWGMLLLMLAISVVGNVVHYFIGNQMVGSQTFAKYTIIGFMAMLLIYFMDFTLIAKYVKVIAGIFLCATLGAIWLEADPVNGRTCYLSFHGWNISLFPLLMLYVPLFGAILYQYYGESYKGIVKSLVWLFIPIGIALYLPSFTLAAILFGAMSVVFSVAVLKGWFQVSKKKVLVVFWCSVFGLPGIKIMFGIGRNILSEYGITRLRDFLNGQGKSNYLTELLREYFSNSQLLGASGQKMVGFLPDFNSDYIFTYLSASYGILAGAAVCGLLAVLIMKVFSVSFRQKNQLGMMMGCGCGMVLLINSVLNILENLGMLPVTQTFLPFFSVGGSSIVVCYILMGLILSIYRQKNILPRHLNVKLQSRKLRNE